MAEGSALRQRVMLLAVLLAGVVLVKSASGLPLTGVQGIEQSAYFYSRLVGWLAFLVTALLFAWHVPSIKSFTVVVICLVLPHAFAGLVLPLFADAVLASIFSYSILTLYAVGNSLFLLEFAYLFSCFQPKTAAMLFVVSQLLENVVMFVFASGDSFSYNIALFIMVPAGLGLFAGAIFWGLRHPGVFDRELQPACCTTSPACADAGQPEGADARHWHQPFAGMLPQQGLIIAVIVVISNAFGVISQVSQGQSASFGLYDRYTSIILILVLLMLLLYMVRRAERLSLLAIFVTVVAVGASGYALYAYTAEAQRLLAGALIRCAFELGIIMMWAVIAREAFDRPARAFFYFGMFRFFSNNTPGRLFGSALMKGQAAADGLVTVISQISLWLLCMCVIAVLVCVCLSRTTAQGRRWLNTVRSVSADSAGDQTPQEPVRRNTLVVDIQHRQMQLNMFCERYHLSQRERDVLEETLSGKNRVSVARQLNLAPDTVKGYLSNIYMKAGVNSRQALIELLENQKIDH